MATLDEVGAPVSGDRSAATAGDRPTPASQLEFGLLGPLTVTVGGRTVDLPGTRTRALLALLLIQANHVVSSDRLIEDLWAGDPTPGATATLQGYMSELRKALSEAIGGPAPVVTRRPGYLITVDPDQLDVLRFERLVERARTAIGDGLGDDRVATLLRDALSQWRGPALADFAGEPFARPVAARLEENRLWALEERVEAELRAGCQHQLVTDLARVVEENPLRERLWGQLMLALYRCGRQAEALRVYQDLRRHLGEELAIDPSPALQRLEHAILIQDPSLETATGVAQAHGDAAGGGLQGGGHDAVPRSEDLAPKLPVQLTRFVGRARELDEARKLLAGARLLSLAGSGGSGKTRLAVQLATEVASNFRDGVRFVDLAAVTDPTQVSAALAAALGLERQGADTKDLCDRLADEHVLLLFDNCEHVVGAAADVIEMVLSVCPRATVLATTQEELGIGGECVWRVPPLSLPPPTEQAETEDLLASEAVQLFVDRATVVWPEFACDRTALESIAHICRRLDGIPLAIELAAGLVTVLALDEIMRRLDDRLTLLGRGRRQAVPRQRTLRAAIDWSYELLSGPERSLFESLSVFVGDFALDAAASVGGRDGDFVSDLSALVAKSMVTTLPGPGGSRRYRLLDSLRQYGLEKLRSANVEAEVRRRHATHYMDFAVAADRRLHGPDSVDWSTRVMEELPNLRAALDWCFSGGDLEVGVELAGALRWWFFGRMGELVQARAWLTMALEPQQGLPPTLRLKALVAHMTIAFSQGDYQWASEHGEEAVTLAQDLGDHSELAVALMARGAAAVFEGNLDRGVECLDRSLEYCDEVGDRWGRAWVLTFGAVAARRSGDHVLARAQLDEALTIFRSVHDDHNQVIPLTQLALVAQVAGDLDAASRYCRDAIVLARRLGDRQLAHSALCISGRVELARGRREEARQLLLSSIRSFRGAENQLVVALALEGLAIVAHEEGRDSDGVRLWGYTDEMRTEKVMPLTGGRLVERDRYLDHARSVLGDVEVQRSLEAGRAMDFHEVMYRVGATSAEPDAEGGPVRLHG